MEPGSLVGELTKGMELARQLKSQMGSQVSGENDQAMLVQGILSSYETALSLLSLGEGSSMVEESLQSPISAIGSPQSEDLNPGFHTQHEALATMGFSGKRKMRPSWTERVRVNSEKEGLPEDGHSWRKYGQKGILGAKYPRSYYRCTYRNLQGCGANKQVQRSDEDPLVFDITYKGTHTCTPMHRSKSAPTSPEKQQQRNTYHSHPLTQFQQPNILLNDLQRGLSVDTQNLETQEAGASLSGYENYHTFTPSVVNDSNFFSSYSPSPSNSTSNYFSRSAPHNVGTYGYGGGLQNGQHSESDIAEMISAATSGPDSHIIGIDYPLQQFPSFQFDNQEFFPGFSQPKE